MNLFNQKERNWAMFMKNSAQELLDKKFMSKKKLKKSKEQ